MVGIVASLIAAFIYDRIRWRQLNLCLCLLE